MLQITGIGFLGPDKLDQPNHLKDIVKFISEPDLFYNTSAKGMHWDKWQDWTERNLQNKSGEEQALPDMEGRQTIYLPNADIRNFSLTDQDHTRLLIFQILKEQNLIKESTPEDIILKKGSVAILLPPEVLLPPTGERETLLEKSHKAMGGNFLY